VRAVKLGEAKLAWRDCGEGEGEKVSWQLESMDDLRKEGKVSSNGKVKTTVPLGLAGVPRPFLPFHSIHQGFAPGDARWGETACRALWLLVWLVWRCRYLAGQIIRVTAGGTG